MSKRGKRRSKRYSGEDAKHLNQTIPSDPVVHRYEAVQRSALGQWWFERRKLIRIGAIVVAAAVGITWLLIELIGVLF